MAIEKSTGIQNIGKVPDFVEDTEPGAPQLGGKERPLGPLDEGYDPVAQPDYWTPPHLKGLIGSFKTRNTLNLFGSSHMFTMSGDESLPEEEGVSDEGIYSPGGRNPVWEAELTGGGLLPGRLLPIPSDSPITIGTGLEGMKRMFISSQFGNKYALTVGCLIIAACFLVYRPQLAGKAFTFATRT